MTVTLGILAGGRGSRMGGADKAWLRRDGIFQVQRLATRLAPETDAVLVSANRGHARYAEIGLDTVRDRVSGLGPIGGLDALAEACTSRWLLTVPVDLVSVNDCLLRSLLACGPAGAHAVDDDGPQPLVALWPVAALRPAAAAAIARNDLAVHALQARLGMVALHLRGVRLGNLNTPQDLIDAGIATE